MFKNLPPPYAKSGRYLTPYPIWQAGGINPYSYVGNDPLNGMDPLGLSDVGMSSYGGRQVHWAQARGISYDLEGNLFLDGTKVEMRIGMISVMGPFSTWNWRGYPAGIPKPEGPFNLLKGAQYNSVRSAVNLVNRAMHKADPYLAGKQIHEIHPVKFCFLLEYTDK
ncbi:MAG: RHS repeat domain-containing protein [Syntrophobacteraceae bacterium]